MVLVDGGVWNGNTSSTYSVRQFCKNDQIVLILMVTSDEINIGCFNRDLSDLTKRFYYLCMD